MRTTEPCISLAHHAAALARIADIARNIALAEGAENERIRIAEILGCAEARGREILARKLAMTTDLSAAACAVFLDGLPVEAAQVRGTDRPHLRIVAGASIEGRVL